ncbi:MAG TPA: nuclear transport factor 2 family protein [Roseiarcus sp.]|nr:nuclear transport factor 2 family protein [Roseiarcus sp.]
MSEATKIADAYIALWNEADRTRRKTLIAKAWTEDAVYVDPMMSGKGHNEIDALIGAVHERFPGASFALAGKPDGYADHVRFSWTLATGQEPPIAHGTDFGTMSADGRLKSIAGFLDHVRT